MISVNLDNITVWRFEDAPKELQALSPHGGDEDWIVFVPARILETPEFVYGTPHWITAMSSLCLDEDPIDVDGGRIWIQSHG